MSDAHGVARDQLRAFIERVERLSEEKKTIEDDIKDVYGEAKSMGYCVKTMKKIVALRKIDDHKRTEEELILDTYKMALGMIPQIEMFDGDEVKPSREDRRRQRTTEAMDDHKSLVDEMADAGLISEEARHENKALADAVATKFGNGPAQALQSPRKAAEAVAEMPRNNQPGMAAEACRASQDAAPVTVRPAETVNSLPTEGSGYAHTEGNATQSGVTDRRDDHLNFETCERCQGNGEIVTDWDRYKHPHEGDIGDEAVAECPDCGGEGVIDVSPDTEFAPASQGEAEAPSVESVSPETHGSSDANTGGEDVAIEQNAAPIEAEAIVSKTASAAHPVLAIRPFCQHPGEEVCGGSGRQHCRACAAAMREEEVA